MWDVCGWSGSFVMLVFPPYVHTCGGVNKGVNTHLTNKQRLPHTSHMSPLHPHMHWTCRGVPSTNCISHLPSHPMLGPGRAFVAVRSRSQL